MLKTITKTVRITPLQEKHLLDNYKNVNSGIQSCIDKDIYPSDDLEILASIRKASRKEVQEVFNHAEWMFFIDSLNGSMTTGNYRVSADILRSHSEDAQIYDATADKWGISIDELKGKIRKLSAAQVEALYCIVEDFWNSQTKAIEEQTEDEKKVRIWIDANYTPEAAKATKLADLEDIPLKDVDPTMGKGDMPGI